ncbi:MAG: YqaA family protein [Gammaproteobacteria bacterium]|nr:YqaA family protein [Gammaproteobacteria bacterium]
MNVFGPLYDRVIRWSRHRHAPRYLALLSFTESSFFPIPPDVMLAPMVLAQRERAWYLASITTIASVLGGLLGYLIGWVLFDQLGQPIIEFYDAEQKLETVKAWFDEYGVWVVFIAGFSPVPYKLFTVTSGLLSMALLPFVLASAVGRGARFFLVAGLIHWGGEPFAAFIEKRVNIIGWTAVAAIVVLLVAFRMH